MGTETEVAYEERSEVIEQIRTSRPGKHSGVNIHCCEVIAYIQVRLKRSEKVVELIGYLIVDDQPRAGDIAQFYIAAPEPAGKAFGLFVFRQIFANIAFYV